MVQKLLSIDIRQDIVCGVMVSVGPSGSAVVGCGVSVVADGSFLESLEEVLLHVEYKNETCRVSFGAENFFYRNLSFPFSDKKKIEKILPIELEESLALDIDDLVVDSLVSGKRGDSSTVIAAMAYRDFIGERLDELATLGIDPDIIAISNVQTALQLSRLQGVENFLLLDAGCHRVTLYAMVKGRMHLIRTMVFDDGSMANFTMDKNSQLISAKRPEKLKETYISLCREIRRTLYTIDDIDPELSVFLTGPLVGVPDSSEHIGDILGCRVEPCDLRGNGIKVGLECGLWRADLMTSALALGIRAGKKQAGFNFRKKEFAKKVSYQKYKKLIPRLGIPTVLCLLVAVGFLWNDFSLREKELASLKKKGVNIFSQTLPEVTRIVDPVQQLKIEIKGMKEGALGEVTALADVLVLDVMAEISVRIPSSINIHIVRMVADKKGIMLRGLTDNFNSVDSIKKVLEKSAYFESVTINSANLATQGAGIRFELKLQLNRG